MPPPPTIPGVLCPQAFLKGVLRMVRAATEGAADGKLCTIAAGAAAHSLPETVRAARAALSDIATTAKAVWETGALLGDITQPYLRDPYESMMRDIGDRARWADGSTYVFLGAYLQRCLRTRVVKGTLMLRHAIRFLLSASVPGTVPDSLRFGLLAELHIGHFRALVEQKERQAAATGSGDGGADAGAGASAGAGAGTGAASGSSTADRKSSQVFVQ